MNRKKRQLMKEFYLTANKEHAEFSTKIEGCISEIVSSWNACEKNGIAEREQLQPPESNQNPRSPN
jgi:hypothetical protein